jgi:hypothetical protein
MKVDTFHRSGDVWSAHTEGLMASGV